MEANVSAKNYKTIVDPVSEEGFAIGFDQSDTAIELQKKRLNTHALLLGRTQTGKTRLMSHIISCVMQFPKAAIVVLDPKGDLANLTVDAAISGGHSSRLDIFDPALREHVIGFNPLVATAEERTDPACVADKAKGLMEAVGAAFGQAAFDRTPRLGRWLYVTFAAALEVGLDLVEAVELLRSQSTNRERVLARIKDPQIRRELVELGNTPPRGAKS
jgi:type IV secretory pathway VirB4 component